MGAGSRVLRGFGNVDGATFRLGCSKATLVLIDGSSLGLRIMGFLADVWLGGVGVKGTV